MSAPQFFVSSKKGEISELRRLLQEFPLEKDLEQQYDTIKKVIGCMTLGIDLSPLFADMVKISRTRNLIIKKMVYLYLVNYSENSQDCVILAMNAFLTDCRDGDYKVRVLALRTLSSIQYSGALSYIQDAVNGGLKDQNPYVRKTAIMGCVKLYRRSPETIKEGDYIETLYTLLKDTDAQVVLNSIIALSEVLEDEGGIVVTKKLAMYLINRLKDFNDWGQALVIELIGRYEPKSDGETVDILSLLEGILTYSNPGVLLAVVKVFLKHTKNSPNVNKQVLLRLQAPLITLMSAAESGENYELSYVVLQHIHLLAARYAARYKLFQDDYKHFFCKLQEGSYIKEIKVEILGHIATEINVQEVLNELTEYVIDVNANLAEYMKKAVNCICHIAVQIPTMVELTMSTLLKFFKYRIEYISSECMIACSRLLRKYPEFAGALIPEIADLHNLIAKAEAKASLIWVLGEYGETVKNAPYVLEYYSMTSPNDFGALNIWYALLTATAKLFFKRPRECKEILKRVIKQLVVNCENCDLRARAVMYYNMLRKDVELARSVIVGSERSEKVEAFWEDRDSGDKEKIEDEFNTCSVIYGKPQVKFMRREYIQKGVQGKLSVNLDFTVEEAKKPTEASASSISKELIVTSL